MNTNIMWFVASGPTSSHLHDVKYFSTLKEARQHAASLPPAPNGGPRPFQITRRDLDTMHVEPDQIIMTSDQLAEAASRLIESAGLSTGTEVYTFEDLGSPYNQIGIAIQSIEDEFIIEICLVDECEWIVDRECGVFDPDDEAEVNAVTYTDPNVALAQAIKILTDPE